MNATNEKKNNEEKNNKHKMKVKCNENALHALHALNEIHFWQIQFQTDFTF